MFTGKPDGPALAAAAAKWFANFNFFKSHSKRVSRDDARALLQIKVMDLETDEALYDAVMSVHDATRHTFNGTGATKIIENHNGRAYIEVKQTLQIIPVQQPPQPPSPPTPTSPLNPGQ